MKGQGLMSAVVIGASLILAAIAFALVNQILNRAGATATEVAIGAFKLEAVEGIGSVAQARCRRWRRSKSLERCVSLLIVSLRSAKPGP